MLIIPFFVLLMRGLGVSFTEYVEILKQIISQHSVGKFFTQFDTVSIEQKMYIPFGVSESESKALYAEQREIRQELDRLLEQL